MRFHSSGIIHLRVRACWTAWAEGEGRGGGLGVREEAEAGEGEETDGMVERRSSGETGPERVKRWAETENWKRKTARR